MDQPGTSYRICVFRSPERYDDYHREYVEIAHPDSFTHMRTLDSYIENFGTAPNEPLLKTIRLQRYRASLHISYEMLGNFSLDFRTLTLNSIAQNQNLQALLLTIFQTISRETDRRLRLDQTREHTVILDKVEVVTQYETNRLLVDLVFYACLHRDSELGLRYFQENLYRLIENSRRGFDQTRSIGNGLSLSPEAIEHSREWLNSLCWAENFTSPMDYFKKYDEKAEERALKLLESILTQGEFEIYTKDGYVIVEGKTHKMYKVKKNSMIEVSEKQKSNLYKTYRLCLEPKNHGTICPTDEVISKIKLIQADEDLLHKTAKRFDNK